MTTNAYLLPVAAGSRTASPSARRLSRYRKLLNPRRALLATALLLAIVALFDHFSPSRRSLLANNFTSPSPSHALADADKDIPRVDRHKHSSQQPLAELSSRPLRDRLDYYFPYKPADRFPAYIWQTWRHTPADGDFPEPFRPFETSWTELHPDFIHEVVPDSVAHNMLRHLYSSIPEVLAAYAALPRVVLKADFFRYLILYARGGIYSDIDTQALRPAVDWVSPSLPQDSYGLVIGIEADPDRADWQEWYSRRIQFCQWTIQAKPGHPVLREVIARITDETLRRKRLGLLRNYNDKDTIEFTGPAAWTDSVMAFFNDPHYFDINASSRNISWQDFTGMTQAKRVGDVVVLPITSFSPGVGHSGAGEDDDPMAFVKHVFYGKSLTSSHGDVLSCLYSSSGRFVEAGKRSTYRRSHQRMI